MLKITHNPRCSKSRETLKLIQEKGAQVEIREYLKDELTKEELSEILKKLGKKPSEILRKGEPIFKEKYKGKTFTEQEWLEIMIANPKLIERPIVYDDKDAELGRPPENVLRLL
ncbi:MAG: arsenate reductase (glutaredoxin) [Chitinophagales bacterium]